MAHEVGQENQVVAPIQEILGVQVPERVRMDNFRNHSVDNRFFFQPGRDASCRKPMSTMVYEQVSALFSGPMYQVLSEPGREVDPPDLPAFRVDVKMSGSHMFHLDLDQFADPRPRCRQRPDDEVPAPVLLLPEHALEKQIVIIADDVFQESVLRQFDSFEP